MERTARMCEEVQVFEGSAERTGSIVELRGLMARNRTCRSVTDLVRRYRLYGDGMFYLPLGHWPDGAEKVELDLLKWLPGAYPFDAQPTGD
jgi:hypothetical protein